MTADVMNSDRRADAAAAPRRARLAVVALALVALAPLSACGGGGGGSGGGGGAVSPPPPVAFSQTASEAARFLGQSTFGPTPDTVDALRSQRPSEWIDAQMALPIGRSAVTHMDERLIELRAANPSASLSSNQFYEYFWREAATAPDQLRQRVRFAYSQIFVISLVDDNVEARGAASYYDMLGANAFGNFRTLLRDVSLHPMMGRYLTHLGNQREDTATGRTPDENYAREVMQLMSIGLFLLNQDGTVQTDSNGVALASYSPADISGLAKVFTGFSWYHPTPTNNTFLGRSRDPDSAIRPMIAYPTFHSISAKTFLGQTIAATTTPDPQADLDRALDVIFNHPNVGPFIGRQLIQRLVTSNPSPAYVARVSAVFANNGAGVRGDMAAVIRAILLDQEARNVPSSNTAGKLREPVVRLANWARAFGATSNSNNWLVNSTSATTSLAQSPLTAPSVFNFYRPGYSPPNTAIGSAGLVAPELQLVNEVTAAGYANTMQSVVNSGIGSNTDVRSALTAEVALAGDPAALADRMNTLLTYGAMSAGLRQRIIDGVGSITIPAATGTNQTAIDTARLNRAKLAVYMTMVSPDYLVQR
jgi:uncharacterized protein (DUF1800 family)